VSEFTHDRLPTTGQPVSRRTVIAAAWTAPVLLVAAPTPAQAASPSTDQMGLNANIGVFTNNVQGNPRAYSFPEGFDPADGHYIEVTITALAGSGILLDSIGASPPTVLRGWTVQSMSSTQVVLRWPIVLDGVGQDTETFLWYWLGTAVDDTIQVTGAITGTTVTGFDEGTLIGPPLIVGVIRDPA
jgi:hypothetical protein